MDLDISALVVGVIANRIKQKAWDGEIIDQNEQKKRGTGYCKNAEGVCVYVCLCVCEGEGKTQGQTGPSIT